MVSTGVREKARETEEHSQDSLGFVEVRSSNRESNPNIAHRSPDLRSLDFGSGLDVDERWSSEEEVDRLAQSSVGVLEDGGLPGGGCESGFARVESRRRRGRGDGDDLSLDVRQAFVGEDGSEICRRRGRESAGLGLREREGSAALTSVTGKGQER